MARPPHHDLAEHHQPVLFVTRRTAPRPGRPGSQFPWKKTDLRPQALREDRILAEAHASGGDARLLCDLFGMSVQGASRYLVTHPPDPDVSTRQGAAAATD